VEISARSPPVKVNLRSVQPGSVIAAKKAAAIHYHGTLHKKNLSSHSFVTVV
jgi:hypothetical protein